MSKRYDVVSKRPGREKDFSHKVGTLFVNDEGRMSIKLDSLPLPNKDGEVWLSVFEPRPRDDAPPRRDERPMRDVMDDDIPF